MNKLTKPVVKKMCNDIESALSEIEKSMEFLSPTKEHDLLILTPP